MRDHRRRIELPAAKEARHLVPRVVHAPAYDAVDRDALEDDFRSEVHVHWLGRNPEHLHASTDANELERLVDRRRYSAHLEHDVDAEVVGRLAHGRANVLWVSRDLRSHLLCERETLVIDVRRDHERCTSGLGNTNGEETDRSTASHE